MLKKIIYYFTSVLAHYHEKQIISKLNLLNFYPKYILDVGAHIGEMTQIFLKNFMYLNKIYCFEPQKEIFKSLKDNSSDKPKCIIANTIKGKGVSFMENQVAWHYKSPSPEELRSALEELRELS